MSDNGVCGERRGRVNGNITNDKAGILNAIACFIFTKLHDIWNSDGSAFGGIHKKRQYPAGFHNNLWRWTLLQDYADTDVAGVGGGALADWGTASPPSWLPAAFGWAADCAHPRLPGDPAIIGDFTAANLSFRREVLVEVGGFAAARGVDGLCRRVRERFPRARLRFDDDLEVFQRMDDDERTFAHFRRRCFAEGRADGARHRTGSAIDRGPGRAFTSTSGTAVIEGLRDGVAGRRDGFRRAGAASAGLAFAAAGYVRGRLPFG